MNLTWSGGLLMDLETGLPAITTSLVGSSWSGGFLRSPIGELVVVFV